MLVATKGLFALVKRVWRRKKLFLVPLCLVAGLGCSPSLKMDLVDSLARVKMNEIITEVNRIDSNLEELNGRVKLLEVDQGADDTRG